MAPFAHKTMTEKFKHLAYNLAHHLLPKHVHLVVAPDAVWAQYLYDNLMFWLKNSAWQQTLYYFSDWETLPYDHYTPHPDLVSERIRVLAELPTLTQGIVITSTSAFRQRLCPQTHLDKFGIHCAVGDHIAQKTVINRLLQAGYQSTHFIAEKGEYATRGNIVDLFPMAAQTPIRLEWLDDEIDSIRFFDLKTQLTLKKCQQLSILPARELDLSDAGRVCFRQSARQYFGEHIHQSGIYQSLSEGRTPQGLEYYLPLFFDETAHLLDYFPSNTCYIPADELAVSLQNHDDYCHKRYQRLNHLRENSLLAPEQLWFSPQELQERLATLPTHMPKNRCTALPFSDETPRGQQWLEQFATAERAVLHFSSQGLREYWFDRLYQEYPQCLISDELPPKNYPALCISPLQYSFCADGITHLAETDRHGSHTTPNYRQNKHKDAGAIIQSLQDLMLGAPVVHIDHGVGRYRGLEMIDDDEMLVIEYAKGARLFVAISDLDLISKYGGTASENAPLHELGGKVWQNAKKKAQQTARDTAAELLAIYAAREAASAQALTFDPHMLADFAQQFEYETTPDQQAAIDAVLNDLQQAKPMDRIVCGDVGFGKTEVAMRAAYAAVLAGYQCAIITPTTLLADQHVHNFLDRFSHTAVRIAAISRFKTPAEQRAIVQSLRDGTIDIVIGTHRLLQKDIAFARLGLVIVDEEHRFGVKHKEALKSLRADVNLLTLTATPIPRTLNLALSGLRDLSIIATAPAGRQSIQTIISQYDPIVIEEACERELNRGGQIYFLHNDVSSIDRIARALSEQLPQARIAVAHGQLRERALEKIMQDFYNRHYDLLVASTIIESGIDIPNANTIIINRADKLGLAQLHQLRGRVGRSHHQAYAYLITPAWQTLNKDAQRRLSAFTELDSLGAGFLLASQDLEIRGAGEILGDEQSGQIQQIGMSYYLDLLERATAALKSGQDFNQEEIAVRYQIDIGEAALLPDTYVFDPQIRLTLYHRLARAKSIAEIDDVMIELSDRFGSLPILAQNLCHKARLHVYAQLIGIEKIRLQTKTIELQFLPTATIDANKLIEKLQRDPQRYKMTAPTSVRILLEEASTFAEKRVHLQKLLTEIVTPEREIIL